MMYPIVRYAHLIGKNTKDFTMQDMVKFLHWLKNNTTGEDEMSNKNLQVSDMQDEGVFQIELSKIEVDTLKWVLRWWLDHYKLHEWSPIKKRAQDILKAISSA